MPLSRCSTRSFLTRARILNCESYSWPIDVANQAAAGNSYVKETQRINTACYNLKAPPVFFIICIIFFFLLFNYTSVYGI